MTTSTPEARPQASSSLAPSARTPLLTDEELDALIEAFNRRDPSPARPHRQLIGLALLALSVMGLGSWWWT
ncbi:MAG: hypothetical protein ACO278_08375 [Limnohabitans sp.]|jgi:hypothetical protein